MSVREDLVEVGGISIPLRVAGPSDGAPVVLLHGFPDCLSSFDAQLEALAAAGYRAMAPALRGYTPQSVAPDGDYFMTTLAADLFALLDALGLGAVHLVGHDWGAVIGWVAIASEPQRFRSFTSLAIPPLPGMQRAIARHPAQLRKSWYMFFFQLRGLADHVVQRNDFAFIERLWRDWSPGWRCPPETMAAVKRTFRAPGVARAALGYYRCMFRLAAAPNRQLRKLAARPVEVPCLVLHGRNDGCMDARLPEAARAETRFDAEVRVDVLDGCGHFLHQERPDAVNQRLLDFLRR